MAPEHWAGSRPWALPSVAQLSPSRNITLIREMNITDEQTPGKSDIRQYDFKTIPIRACFFTLKTFIILPKVLPQYFLYSLLKMFLM